MKKVKLVFLLLMIFSNSIIKAQNKTITFFDETNKNPIVGLQIFSESGAFLGNTNTKGIFELDSNLLKQTLTKSILANNSDYNSIEYKIDEVPETVYLKKNESIQLDEVVVTVRKSLKFYTLNGFFRSWQLINDKLVKYGDGMVMYHMPNAEVENNFVSGVKSYITSYRTFTIDSLDQQIKKNMNQAFEVYLGVSKIPKLDILKSNSNLVIKDFKDNAANIYMKDEKFGTVVYDENKNPIIINTRSDPDEYLKTGGAFRNFKIKYVNNERWIGKGTKRHPTYVLVDVKSKVKSKDDYVETVVEIFLEDDVVYDDIKPVQFKNYANPNKSFYNLNYWTEQFKKYPLPSAISAQLTKINENKNTY